jgi:hypothetical protein
MIETIKSSERRHHHKRRLSLRLKLKLRRRHNHIRRYITIEPGPMRRALTRISVELIRTRAAIKTRIREAEISILTECSGVLRVSTATYVASRYSFIVHQRNTHAWIEAWRRQTRIIQRVVNIRSRRLMSWKMSV